MADNDIRDNRAHSETPQEKVKWKVIPVAVPADMKQRVKAHAKTTKQGSASPWVRSLIEAALPDDERRSGGERRLAKAS